MPEFGDVFELRVALRHVEPTIWRSVRVPADAPLGVLHDVLQVAFGWTNSHLHDFHVGDIRFGMARFQAQVEAKEGGDDEAIRCTGGARACPPEDCGGAPGYANLVSALANPKHPEHGELKRWAPRGFDPDRFDIVAVNKKLGTLSKRLGRRRKP